MASLLELVNSIPNLVDLLSTQKSVSTDELSNALHWIAWNAFERGLYQADSEMLVYMQTRIELMSVYVAKQNELALYFASKYKEEGDWPLFVVMNSLLTDEK